MNPSIEARLQSLAERFDEIERLLSDATVIGNQDRFRKLSQEYAEITPAVRAYREYEQAKAQLDSAHTMLKDSDAGIREMAQDELAEAQKRMAELEKDLLILLLPKDPDDTRNV